MAGASDIELIELAYTASIVLVAEESRRPWNEPIDQASPAELENDCYSLARQFGLKPVLGAKSIAEIQMRWRQQLRSQRQRDLFDLGMLLVTQHALVSFLQCHPDAPERPEVCFRLDHVRTSLTSLFNQFQIPAAMAKMPDVPLPGVSGAWMEWSGDALRDCIKEELAARLGA